MFWDLPARQYNLDVRLSNVEYFLASQASSTGLTPRQVAGIVIGSLLAAALLTAISVVAIVVVKRRRVAAYKPYTDTTAVFTSPDPLAIQRIQPSTSVCGN